VYIKCSKSPKYFKQRCYVKSFCKNSKSSDVTAVSYCWFVRQRFGKSASTDRSTFSMTWFPDAFCWLQTFLIACLYHFCGRFWKHVCCTPYVKKVNEIFSKHLGLLKGGYLWGAVCKNIISDRFSTKTAISGRDSYLCMQRCYLWQRYLSLHAEMLQQKFVPPPERKQNQIWPWS